MRIKRVYFILKLRNSVMRFLDLEQNMVRIRELAIDVLVAKKSEYMKYKMSKKGLWKLIYFLAIQSRKIK